MGGSSTRHLVVRIFLCWIYLIYYITESIIWMCIPLSWRPKKDISKDIVLITGGGGGVGRLLAQKLATIAAQIIVWDINKRAIDETVQLIEECGGVGRGYVVDVSDRHQVYKAAQDVGNVNILINNAGIINGTFLLDTPDERIDKTIQTNVLSNFWTLKAFLPGMISKGRGHVVTICSSQGYTGGTKMADYCCSKFGSRGLHESLSLELWGKYQNNIDVSLVSPGWINTGMFSGASCDVLTCLNPDYVAERTVTAILHKEEEVIIPAYYNALFTIKMLVPWKVYRKAFHLLGCANFMDSFKPKMD